MIGIGVVGTGFGRMVHIPGFQAVRNAKVIGVASANYHRARQTTEEFGLSRCFASWQELVVCPDIDAVSIATPPVLHEPIALAAIAAGKAVFCEKPLAMNASQACRMLAAAQEAGVCHAVDFEFREIAAWRFVKHLLEARELGALRHINVNWIVHSWADPTRPWSWRAEQAQSGGTLGALGAHVFDYIEWFGGPIKALTAHLSIRVGQRPDQQGVWRPVSSEDCCHLLLELHDGTPVSLVISAVAPLGTGHRIELHGERQAIVLASNDIADYGKGFAVWESKPGSARLHKRRLPRAFQAEREFADGRLEPFVRLAQRFVDAVEQKRDDMRPSFADGLRSRMLMGLALQSHTERRWISARGGPRVDAKLP